MKSMLNVGTCVGIREDIVYAGFRDGKMVGVQIGGKKGKWEVQAHKGAVTTIYMQSKDYILTGG